MPLRISRTVAQRSHGNPFLLPPSCIGFVIAINLDATVGICWPGTSVQAIDSGFVAASVQWAHHCALFTMSSRYLILPDYCVHGLLEIQHD